MLKDRKVIAIGERDGVSGMAIEACVTAAGGTVVFSATECYVWTAAGAMDLPSQEAILKLTEKHDPSQLLVLLGAPDPEAAEIAAETVVLGDPSYAGPLAGVQLGLDVHHILEPEIRASIPDDVWEDQIGVMADVLDADALTAAVAGMREQANASKT